MAYLHGFKCSRCGSRKVVNTTDLGTDVVQGICEKCRHHGPVSKVEQPD